MHDIRRGDAKMPTEQVKTRATPLPNSLTDRELVSFADRYIHTSGLPSDYQRELLKRFEEKLNGK
jgi:hypothetical protein